MDLYTTKDELAFISHLLMNNRPAFFKYADLVRNKMRRFDRSIDVREVLQHLNELEAKEVKRTLQAVEREIASASLPDIPDI